MGVFFHPESALPAVKDRVLMTGAGRNKLSGRNRQDAQPDGHEHGVLISFAEAVVDIAEDFSRSAASVREGDIFDQGLGNDHEESCGHALARDIRHDQSQMVVVDQEKVIEIASHLFGGIHDGIEIKLLPFRKCREMVGQHIDLNIRGDREFGIQALFFCGDIHDLAHIPPHLF